MTTTNARERFRAVSALVNPRLLCIGLVGAGTLYVPQQYPAMEPGENKWESSVKIRIYIE